MGKKGRERTKILITGGAGFIGSHLCDYYIQKGYKVWCLDNLSSGNIKNIKHLLKLNNFNFIKHNITIPLVLPKVDTILHFASPASIPNYRKQPMNTILVNSLGTLNILRQLRKNIRFIFASSSEVYGNPNICPQREDYNGNVSLTGERSVYDESKRFGEVLVKQFPNCGIVRIFNTYGKRMMPDRVIPAFIYQAINNSPITIFGDGSQTRSFCYIDDLIEGINKYVLSQINQPINLGNTEEITILQLAKKIKKIINSKSNFTFKNLPENDPSRRKPDITKAKKLLAWSPCVTLEEGLKKLL